MSYTVENATHINRILETKNFYEVLQVPSNATPDQIKAAYKQLSLLVHPDKNNAPRAQEAFVAMRRAAAILLDKEKRKEYDEYLCSPTGFCKEKFDLSDDAVDTILVTAGIAGVVGIAAGLIALYDWWTSPKKDENKEPKYAK